MECMRNFKDEVGKLGGSVDNVEKKMGEYATSYNSLVDAHNEQSDELTWLKEKVANLEDRSHRNNMKLRGIPESIQPTQLQQYAQEFMLAYLPSVPSLELVIDRIHRLPKPAHLPDNIPRDVLMRVHFFHMKEQFMLAFRKNAQPPEQYTTIQVFADLSQFTMQKRKSLITVTKALHNHNIVYTAHHYP